MRRILAFELSGPSEISFKVEGNPIIDHDGKRTIGHLLLSEEERSSLGLQLCKLGLQIRFTDLQEQTAEQMLERSRLLSNFTPPTDACPSCFFYDVLTHGLCGLTDWPTSTVQAAIEGEEKAKRDMAHCPLQRGMR